MTRDREVVINSDNIYIAGEPDKSVMMEWETPLMKKHAEVVTKNGGDILEIGFGMGISSNFIHQSGVKSHTIIELKKDIYQKALEWYNSEEYKPIREIRFKNAKSIGMIIEGA
jgi:guanidinoacetate N-methyltransferase